MYGHRFRNNPPLPGIPLHLTPHFPFYMNYVRWNEVSEKQTY
ncbi:hypothetical protein QE396_004628 [Enterobacter sp. SORGH_AS 287]|nr:hypothetical protein [Enterobacter sp. SORGH_AS_0287]